MRRQGDLEGRPDSLPSLLPRPVQRPKPIDIPLTAGFANMAQLVVGPALTRRFMVVVGKHFTFLLIVVWWEIPT